MNNKIKVALICLLLIALVGTAIWFMGSLHFAVLDPKGLVAQKQYDLLVFTTLLGLIIVVPVFIMTIVIAWRYREGNTKAKYTPNIATNKIAETIWWGIPIVLIVILSVVTWNSTHNLDPYRAFDKNAEPLKIQVVALDWKWLFIYPEQNIATINYVQMPVDRQLQFDITSDATMNSFWIPQLGGQIYAMAGMSTKLHLNATEPGDYKGSSANISGEGFAGMKFIARARSAAEFEAWVSKTKATSPPLSSTEYASLSKQSKANPAAFYSSVPDELYDTIVMKYMMPSHEDQTGHDMSEMNHTNMGTH